MLPFNKELLMNSSMMKSFILTAQNIFVENKITLEGIKVLICKYLNDFAKNIDKKNK